MSKFSGGCLCGAVRYECSGEPIVTAHCYCVDCRKASGTSHCTHIMMRKDDVAASGPVKWYDRAADSGNVVSRGFCSECGSAVLSRNSGVPNASFVRASSLDDLEAVTPAMIVYAARAPSWAHMDESLPSFPEMPPGGPPEI